jgi:hypothetical protein
MSRTLLHYSKRRDHLFTLHATARRFLFAPPYCNLNDNHHFLRLRRLRARALSEVIKYKLCLRRHKSWPNYRSLSLQRQRILSQPLRLCFSECQHHPPCLLACRVLSANENAAEHRLQQPLSQLFHLDA